MSEPSLARRIALSAGRIPLPVRITIVVVLALLVAGSGAVSGLLSAQASSDAAAQANAAAATAAAKKEMPQLLTWNYKTIAADLKRASADTTGQFAGEFSVMASQDIGPEAVQQKTVATAVAPVVAPVASSGDQVSVLVFADQSVTNKVQPKPQIEGSELLVTMQKVNGRWLIAMYEPM